MSLINKMNISNVSYDIQAGEKVQLTFPAGATNGTLTDKQLVTLQANYQSCIEMVNDKELYYLNDNGHTDGYLTYSHVGIENSKATIKTLTITVSAKSFVIVTTVVSTESGGGKLYQHKIVFGDKNEYTGYFVNSVEAPYTKISEISRDIYINLFNENTSATNAVIGGGAMVANDEAMYMWNVYANNGNTDLTLKSLQPQIFLTKTTVADTVTEL